ncbi:MAG: type II toxin-antitoxin system prevent-host-death family antitoxin [Alphaproteobacteria bacterium]|nr:MAG: type II toxin-antitoxin system prevent-host-death family antitoxin [Alphaproteobacteria bacterium]
MSTIGAYEAKTHLPKLLDRVAKGERITIARHGTPVAVLEPVEQARMPDPHTLIAEIRKFRKGHKLGDMSIREMIEEGRR